MSTRVSWLNEKLTTERIHPWHSFEIAPSSDVVSPV